MHKTSELRVSAVTGVWSSRPAFYLVTVGAAVGLGSIWRFPYLAGRYGGGTFIAVFVLTCALIAIPLLVAEFTIGRTARCSAPRAAGEVAARNGLSRRWNVIGWLGTLASFLIFSYYTMIAGWVLAYVWKTGSGSLVGQSRVAIGNEFHRFLGNPITMAEWQLAFLAAVGIVSSSGIRQGIERVSRVRAPALLLLLLVLVMYSLYAGDASRGLLFAFAPRTDTISGGLVLAAVSQSFYATSVGMAMMIAYGAYVPADTSLLRSAAYIVGSIIVVSILATVIVFPLVFRYGLDPTQGPALVFEILPIVFAEMPAGRFIGTLFFLLLLLAALTPSIAAIEPAVAWLEERGVRRRRAVWFIVGAGWCLGLGSVLSFNRWSSWRPLKDFSVLTHLNFFELVDFLSADVLLPIGAVLTSVLIGWRLWDPMELSASPGRSGVKVALRVLLRYVCPTALLAILMAAFA